MCVWSIAVCCGDIFCTGVRYLLNVVEDIDVCRTFFWLPCCDTEYFNGTVMCPLVTCELCTVACSNRNTCQCLTAQHSWAVATIQRNASMACVWTQWLDFKIWENHDSSKYVELMFSYRLWYWQYWTYVCGMFFRMFHSGLQGWTDIPICEFCKHFTRTKLGPCRQESGIEIKKIYLK